MPREMDQVDLGFYPKQLPNIWQPISKNKRTKVYRPTAPHILRLKDARGKARIIERIRSAERCNFGDCESIGQGISELRIHFGPGYHVYFTRVGNVVYVLLCGGIKRNQQRDIAKALEIIRLLKEE